ncbi:hypothetical protein PMI41_00548 [Phyllobacterium sp. YR531]|nr:hypothetical protein PMI41_00548 [Phyllobacterium sp. YR531]
MRPIRFEKAAVLHNRNSVGEFCTRIIEIVLDCPMLRIRQLGNFRHVIAIGSSFEANKLLVREGSLEC